MDFVNRFGEARALLQNALRFLLVLPEIRSADLRLQFPELVLFLFYFKDNSEGERFSLSPDRITAPNPVPFNLLGKRLRRQAR
jgi:hypothetical protein